MNIRKIVFHKYFLIFFPVFIVNIIGTYIYFNAYYFLSLDYWELLKIVGVFGLYNVIINPIYQLIINIIYNTKEGNECYFENIILMVSSVILGFVMIFILSAIQLIINFGYVYFEEDDIKMIFLEIIIVFITIILGVIEKFILTKIFNKIKNK